MCSYCGCQSISLIGRFMAEHESIVNVAGELHRLSGDLAAGLTRSAQAGDREAVLAALDHTLEHLDPHTHAEEVGLFRVLRRNPDFTEHVDTLCAEHAALDAMAEEIKGGRLELIDRFVGELRTHINKEENGLFPAAAIEMDGPDWEEAIGLSPEELPHEHEHAYPQAH